jgi:hypothetical protein
MTRSEALTTIRGRIAALVKAHPDDSHGEGWRNSGLESALRVLDFALDAPCRFRPTTYGQWCELHSSPVSDDSPMVGDRCGGHRYSADQVLA